MISFTEFRQMSTEEKNEEILRKSFLPFYLNPTVQVQILTWVCFRFDFTDLGLYLDLEFELRLVNTVVKILFRCLPSVFSLNDELNELKKTLNEAVDKMAKVEVRSSF